MTTSNAINEYQLDEISSKLKTVIISLDSYLDYNFKQIAPTEYEKNEKIILNARGTKFEILTSLMNRIPNSRLSKIKQFYNLSQKDPAAANEFFISEQLCDGYNPKFNEFYFNKDPHILSVALGFFEARKNKHTHINITNVCPFAVEEDLDYWGILNFDHHLEPCCVIRLEKAKEKLEREITKERKVIDELNYRFDFGRYCCPSLRRSLWAILDNPKSSFFAKVIFL